MTAIDWGDPLNTGLPNFLRREESPAPTAADPTPVDAAAEPDLTNLDAVSVDIPAAQPLLDAMEALAAGETRKPKRTRSRPMEIDKGPAKPSSAAAIIITSDDDGSRPLIRYNPQPLARSHEFAAGLSPAEMIENIKTWLTVLAVADNQRAVAQKQLGLHLLELKRLKPADLTWPEYLAQSSIGLKVVRANELIRIAEGRTTVEQAQAATRKRVERHRTLRNVQSDPDVEPVEITEIIAPERATTAEPADIRAIVDDDNYSDQPTEEELRRAGYLHCAAEALKYAGYHDLSGDVIDQEMVDAAAKVVEAWTSLLHDIERQGR